VKVWIRQENGELRQILRLMGETSDSCGKPLYTVFCALFLFCRYTMDEHSVQLQQALRCNAEIKADESA
jgi:hypothetical protein